MTLNIQPDHRPTSPPSPPARPSMVIAKLFYFCNFAAMAAIMPFLALYYKQVGLTGREIGLLASLSPLVMLLAAPLWGGLADATQKHRLLLLTAICGFLIAIVGLSLATTLFWLFPLVILYAFFSAPIIPLVDNSVLEALAERKREYGKQRLWGSIGWGVGAVLMGAVIERYGLAWAFYGCLIFMSVNLFAATRLRVSHASIASDFWRNLRYFVTSGPWLVFLITLFINGLGMSFTNNFLFLYMNQLHANEKLMGVALFAASLSELPAFFFADRLLHRWGSRGLLITALLAQAVRMFAYAIMPNPWFVLPINLLHGLTFSAMWVAAVNYANEHTPAGLGATAQGVLSGVSMGLAGMAGALVGGILYDSVGPATMFGWGGAATLVGLLFFIIAGRLLPQPNVNSKNIAFGQD